MTGRQQTEAATNLAQSCMKLCVLWWKRTGGEGKGGRDGEVGCIKKKAVSALLSTIM